MAQAEQRWPGPNTLNRDDREKTARAKAHGSGYPRRWRRRRLQTGRMAVKRYGPRALSAADSLRPPFETAALEQTGDVVSPVVPHAVNRADPRTRICEEIRSGIPRQQALLLRYARCQSGAQRRPPRCRVLIRGRLRGTHSRTRSCKTTTSFPYPLTSLNNFYDL